MNNDMLKGKMVEKKYTQKRLAEEVGITIQSLNAKLNKRSQFTLDEVVKIISILGIDTPCGICEIFFEDSVPNKQQKVS